METRIDAACTACGATFSRSDAETGTDGTLACPACGCGVIRGIPAAHSALTERDTARCGSCGATFPRSEARTETKGRLACPDCGANDVQTIEDEPA